MYKNNPPAKKTAWLKIILLIQEAIHCPKYVEKSRCLNSKISEKAFIEIKAKNPAIAITINILRARFIPLFLSSYNINYTSNGQK